jgi:hypothetical protein
LQIGLHLTDFLVEFPGMGIVGRDDLIFLIPVSGVNLYPFYYAIAFQAINNQPTISGTLPLFLEVLLLRGKK